MIAALVLAVWPQATAAAAAEPEAPAEPAGRALAWLLAHQNPDGSWGHWRNPGAYDAAWSNLETHKAWQAAITGLAVEALADAAAADPAADADPALWQAWERAVDFVAERAPAIRRPSDWDTDNEWAYVYGLTAMVRAAGHPRLAAPGQEARAAAVAAAGRRLLALLDAYQTPFGGWAYYADETLARRPYWTTSFVTAVVILGLLDARELGWPVDEARLRRAIDLLRHCRLPSGAYTYSARPFPSPGGALDIDQVRGSLSRIQVGNLALYRAAAAGFDTGVAREDLRHGIALFLGEHRFLDLAYQRPTPHESWYANSGYFYFFGHRYAAEVLQELEPEDRARWGPALRRHVVKTQAGDGSMFDFFMNEHARPYGVAFGLSALARTTPPAAAAPAPDRSRE